MSKVSVETIYKRVNIPDSIDARDLIKKEVCKLIDVTEYGLGSSIDIGEIKYDGTTMYLNIRIIYMVKEEEDFESDI